MFKDQTRQPKSSFQNSLLFLVLLGISEEIWSDENTWFTGEYFRNDPRQNPGERLLHYIKTGAAKRFVHRFKQEHPELIWNPNNQPTQNAKVA